MTRFALDRGRVKDYAEAIVAQQFGFSAAAVGEAKSRAAKFIRHDYYIFPPKEDNPVSIPLFFRSPNVMNGLGSSQNKLDLELPYNNPAIRLLLSRLAFRNKTGIFKTHPHCFEVADDNSSHEFPQAMVALVATAVCLLNRSRRVTLLMNTSRFMLFSRTGRERGKSRDLRVMHMARTTESTSRSSRCCWKASQTCTTTQWQHYSPLPSMILILLLNV